MKTRHNFPFSQYFHFDFVHFFFIVNFIFCFLHKREGKWMKNDSEIFISSRALLFLSVFKCLIKRWWKNFKSCDIFQQTKSESLWWIESFFDPDFNVYFLMKKIISATENEWWMRNFFLHWKQLQFSLESWILNLSWILKHTKKGPMEIFMIFFTAHRACGNYISDLNSTKG